jgi:hypothetical protein
MGRRSPFSGRLLEVLIAARVLYGLPRKTSLDTSLDASAGPRYTRGASVGKV